MNTIQGLIYKHGWMNNIHQEEIMGEFLGNGFIFMGGFPFDLSRAISLVTPHRLRLVDLPFNLFVSLLAIQERFTMAANIYCKVYYLGN